MSPCVINAVEGPGGVFITGSGFAPDSKLTISTDGNAAAFARSDAAGALSYVLRTPIGEVLNLQTVQLTVADAAGTSAQTSYQAAFQLIVVPGHSTVGQPAELRTYGVPGTHPVRLKEAIDCKHDNQIEHFPQIAAGRSAPTG